jgi:hypothetical protein
LGGNLAIDLAHRITGQLDWQSPPYVLHLLSFGLATFHQSAAESVQGNSKMGISMPIDADWVADCNFCCQFFAYFTF